MSLTSYSGQQRMSLTSYPGHDMWSYFLAPVTNLAAAFCILCKRRRRSSLTPYNRLLQQSSRPPTNACANHVLAASVVNELLMARSCLNWKKHERQVAEATHGMLTLLTGHRANLVQTQSKILFFSTVRNITFTTTYIHEWSYWVYDTIGLPSSICAVLENLRHWHALHCILILVNATLRASFRTLIPVKRYHHNCGLRDGQMMTEHRGLVQSSVTPSTIWRYKNMRHNVTIYRTSGNSVVQQCCTTVVYRPILYKQFCMKVYKQCF